jgi:hypothetical protein
MAFLQATLRITKNLTKTKAVTLGLGLSFLRKLISRLVFRNTEGKFQNGEFVLSWDGWRSNQKVKCALILQNKLIIWHDGKSSKFGIMPNRQNRDKLFEYLVSE